MKDFMKRLQKVLKKSDELEAKRKKMKNPKAKVKKVLDEYKAGKLHSGSKKGPLVKDKKQALAIGISEAREAGAKIPKKKK